MYTITKIIFNLDSFKYPNFVLTLLDIADTFFLYHEQTKYWVSITVLYTLYGYHIKYERLMKCKKKPLK